MPKIEQLSGWFLGKRCDACAEKLHKARSEAQRQCIKKYREKHNKKQRIQQDKSNNDLRTCWLDFFLQAQNWPKDKIPPRPSSVKDKAV